MRTALVGAPELIILLVVVAVVGLVFVARGQSNRDQAHDAETEGQRVAYSPKGPGADDLAAARTVIEQLVADRPGTIVGGLISEEEFAERRSRILDQH
jgi:hypothetical protein